jgi:hypothetical protein
MACTPRRSGERDSGLAFMKLGCPLGNRRITAMPPAVWDGKPCNVLATRPLYRWSKVKGDA